MLAEQSSDGHGKWSITGLGSGNPGSRPGIDYLPKAYGAVGPSDVA